MTDEYLLPPQDWCVYSIPGGCGRTEAEHIPFRDGGPAHSFVAPEGKPRPDRMTSCHIQTDWTCVFCGEDNDVWGAAEGWMECGKCMKYSYLVPFM